ncbi:jumonji domain containing 4 [Glossina fuscipes fuscipes]
MAPDLKLLELNPPIESHCQHNSIERFDGKQLSYNDFFWHFMNTNWPVILTDVSNNWECRKNWLQYYQGTSNGNRYTATINFNYLKQRIGNRSVPVANCNREYYNSHAKSEMKFYDFLNYWQQKCEREKVENSNVETNTTDILYLKDWHLKAESPDYDFYEVPKHFASDWLNEYLLSNKTDDYRFVYMGPKDTWTPFHADVFGSFSWSTNIMGCKKWLLLPNGEELKLKDHLNNLPFHIDESLLEKKGVQYFTVLQTENEALFVPSGWYHQVWNQSDTISINHNWFNSCNLERIWHNLAAAMQQVINEIEDCRQMDNFNEHCQTMLRATFGLNYLDFIQLIETITERRLHCCTENGNEDNRSALNSDQCSSSSRLAFFNTHTPNDYHIRHDLHCIQQLMKIMLEDPVIFENRTFLYRQCVRLSELISSTLSLSTLN